jgi:hypothetical protein
MDVQALAALPSLSDPDKETLEDLKDMLAFTGDWRERAMTLAEATACATALRQFAARRDVIGMKQWIKEKFPESE